MNPVYDMFNDIANRMVMKEDGEEYISNTVKMKGASGTEHELSIDQALMFLSVLNGSHDFLSMYNPLEFLLFSYQFQDKIKLDYLAVRYQIIYDADDDSIFVSGVTKHPMSVEGHPTYVPGTFIPAVTFQTTIPNVGLYGGLALVNCIAQQNPDFAPIKGSFGGSFIYEFAEGRQSIKQYVPQAISDGIPDHKEAAEEILRAVRKYREEHPELSVEQETKNEEIHLAFGNVPSVDEDFKMDIMLSGTVSGFGYEDNINFSG